MMKGLKIIQKICFTFILSAFCLLANAQYKTYKISVKGDTINAVKEDGKKVGKWVETLPELRGEPGYVEEGIYKNGEKDGVWRKYTLQGDLLAAEYYKLGGKDGIQQYFNFVGQLLREESWRGYNPDAPYDTIAIYGTGSNEILRYDVVKAKPYSVKHGDWRYYDPQSGAIMKTITYEINNIKVPGKNANDMAKEEEPAEKKEIKKTAQMLEWEKKNSGKKGALREGRTVVQ